MKKNQYGFSAVEIVIVTLVIGLLGLGGWFVLQRSQDEHNKSSNSTTNTNGVNDSANQEQEEIYQLPEGFILYEHTQPDFKFAYPEEWGRLQVQSDPNALFVAKTPEINSPATYVGGKLEISAARTEDFVHQAVYHGVSVKPIKAGSGYTWEVVDPGLQSEQYSAGDTFIPEENVFTGRNLKTIIFERDNLKVYNFATGHACGGWYSFAFASGDYFVGIKFPSHCAMDASTHEEADASFDAYKDTIQRIAETIRIDI